MGKKETLIHLAFACIFMGGYDALVKPMIQKKLMSGGELYNWGVASSLLFMSGFIGLIVGWALTKRRRHPEAI